MWVIVVEGLEVRIVKTRRVATMASLEPFMARDRLSLIALVSDHTLPHEEGIQSCSIEQVCVRVNDESFGQEKFGRGRSFDSALKPMLGTHLRP